MCLTLSEVLSETWTLFNILQAHNSAPSIQSRQKMKKKVAKAAPYFLRSCIACSDMLLGTQ